MTKSKGLGRGLAALMASTSPLLVPTSPATDTGSQNDGVVLAGSSIERVPIAQLVANPFQPRRQFDEQRLEELTASIRHHGVIQPIVVRPRPDGRYEIVAGERRWRASQRAGLTEVPIYRQDYSDNDVLKIALLENIQRADLTPMEEAEAYQTLIERLGCTHEELAQQLGKSRSVITNSLRLLQLPIDIQRAVAEGRLTAGHARCLIGSDQPERWMSKILDGGWSVRRTEQAIQAERERMIRPARALPAGSPTEIAAPALLANLQDTKDPLPREWTCVADSSRGDVEQSDDAQMIVSSLADRLGGTRVTLHLAPTGQRGGALTLYYEHTHELDALLQVTAGWEHPSAALPLTVRKESTNELDA